MVDIGTPKPKAGKPGQLTIDIVVKLPSGLHHMSRLTHSGKGLYDVARTYESRSCPIDMHASYHPSGEMHSKLTRGHLLIQPGGQVLGKAQPHTQDREVLLWKRKGQPWASLRGVEKFGLHEQSAASFANISDIAAGYPIYERVDADYMFEVDTLALTSAAVAIEYFLVEPGNVAALEQIIEDAVRGFENSWHLAGQGLVLERADLFTNLNPWLAIVLFAKKDDCLNPL